MVLPHHRYWYESVRLEFGKRAIHLCGDATRHFPILKEELGVTCFDTGFPVDFAGLRKKLGPDVEIIGGVEIGTLLTGSPDDVYRRSREILTSGIMEGGRFIFREGNNLPPNIAWSNLAAMYKAVQDYGNY
jgi:uroporphyrinogen-III decarboxylase